MDLGSTNFIKMMEIVNAQQPAAKSRWLDSINKSSLYPPDDDNHPLYLLRLHLPCVFHGRQPCRYIYT